MAQRASIIGVERRGTYEVFRRLFRSTRNFEEARRVKRKFKRMRIEIAGLLAV